MSTNPQVKDGLNMRQDYLDNPALPPILYWIVMSPRVCQELPGPNNGSGFIRWDHRQAKHQRLTFTEQEQKARIWIKNMASSNLERIKLPVVE